MQAPAPLRARSFRASEARAPLERSVRLAAAWSLACWLMALTGFAPAQVGEASGPDRVIISSGHHFQGTVVRENDRQVEIEVPGHGSFLIPSEEIVSLIVATPEEAIATAYADPAAFRRDGPSPSGTVPAPPDGRLFSVMPGDRVSATYPLTGPLNPLDDRLFVSPSVRTSAGGQARQTPSDSAGAAGIRAGYDAMILETLGEAQAMRGGDWEAAEPNMQLSAGSAVRVASGKVAVAIRGGALLLLQAGTQIQLVSVSADGSSLALALEAGHVWVERQEAPILADIRASAARFGARSRRFSATVDRNGGAMAATFDGPLQVSNLAGGGDPIVIEAPAMIAVGADGLIQGPTRLDPTQAASFRDPSAAAGGGG